MTRLHTKVACHRRTTKNLILTLGATPLHQNEAEKCFDNISGTTLLGVTQFMSQIVHIEIYKCGKFQHHSVPSSGSLGRNRPNLGQFLTSSGHNFWSGTHIRTRLGRHKGHSITLLSHKVPPITHPSNTLKTPKSLIGGNIKGWRHQVTNRRLWRLLTKV